MKEIQIQKKIELKVEAALRVDLYTWEVEKEVIERLRKDLQGLFDGFEAKRLKLKVTKVKKEAKG